MSDRDMELKMFWGEDAPTVGLGGGRRITFICGCGQEAYEPICGRCLLEWEVRVALAYAGMSFRLWLSWFAPLPPPTPEERRLSDIVIQQQAENSRLQRKYDTLHEDHLKRGEVNARLNKELQQLKGRLRE